MCNTQIKQILKICVNIADLIINLTNSPKKCYKNLPNKFSVSILTNPITFYVTSQNK